MQTITDPIIGELVLIGGGHSHVQAIKHFAMKPIRGLRITLVSDRVEAPYSGMLPSLLAGWYRHEQAHFDMQRICQRAGIRLIIGEVTDVDALKKVVTIHGYPPLRYDLLSINVGSRPKMIDTFNNNTTALGKQLIPLKPIYRFLPRWNSLIGKLKTWTSYQPASLAVVGGGVAGVEVSLILQQLLKQMDIKADLNLFQRDAELLPGHSEKIVQTMKSKLSSAGIGVNVDHQVRGYDGQIIKFERAGKDHQGYPAHFVLLATQAAAPRWIRDTALAVNPEGFLRVDDNLRVQGQDDVFGAGDCIHFESRPLPKAGVFAVRQGKILSKNLRIRIMTMFPRKRFVPLPALKAYQPQKKTLALITSGERKATMSYHLGGIPLSFEGRWVWLWKDWVDRRFMERFQNIPKMESILRYKDSLIPKHWEYNRCGDCGSKLNPGILQGTLKDLKERYPHAMMNTQTLNDGAILHGIDDHRLVVSYDQFRRFTRDPFIFGKVIAHHIFNHIYSMGAKPHSAIVSLTLPPASQAVQQNELDLVMSGILDVLSKEGAGLACGQSAEGAELTAGIAVHGLLAKDQAPLTKSGLEEGDLLILTKPLGTGILFAANMDGNLPGHRLEALIKTLLTSQKEAVKICRVMNVKSCIDVAGLGLGGHLQEMAAASQKSVEIFYKDLPFYKGVLECIASGYEASLATANAARLLSFLTGKDDVTTERLCQQWPLLFDPQTNGGLLCAVKPDKRQECIEALQDIGLSSVKVIGQVMGPSPDGRLKVLAS